MLCNVLRQRNLQSKRIDCLDGIIKEGKLIHTYVVWLVMVVLDVVVRQLEELGQLQEGQLREDQVQIQGLDHLLQTIEEHQIE